MSNLALLGHRSEHGVGSWEPERCRDELPILRQCYDGHGLHLRFADGGVVPEPGHTWQRPWTGARPIRCRVLSIEDDGVRFYVGSRRWYGQPGTYTMALSCFRSDWTYVYPAALRMQFPDPRIAAARERRNRAEAEAQRARRMLELALDRR